MVKVNLSQTRHRVDSRPRVRWEDKMLCVSKQTRENQPMVRKITRSTVMTELISLDATGA